MSGKFIRNWLILPVVLLVLTSLWHLVIFSTNYNEHLPGIARMVDGAPAPLIVYFLLAHVLAAFGFLRFVPAVSGDTMSFMKNGMVMGWLTFGFFAILSHALFQNWTGWLMGMDIAFGTLCGIITGWVHSKIA